MLVRGTKQRGSMEGADLEIRMFATAFQGVGSQTKIDLVLGTILSAGVLEQHLRSLTHWRVAASYR